jgi:hypothetical protein
LIKECIGYNLVDGTRMKIKQRAASTKRKVKNEMIPRFTRRLRTYGSVIRLKFIRVYSDKPTKARIGSSIHSYELRAYTPSVKGRIN